MWSRFRNSWRGCRGDHGRELVGATERDAHANGDRRVSLSGWLIDIEQDDPSDPTGRQVGSAGSSSAVSPLSRSSQSTHRRGIHRPLAGRANPRCRPVALALTVRWVARMSNGNSASGPSSRVFTSAEANANPEPWLLAPFCTQVDERHHGWVGFSVGTMPRIWRVSAADHKRKYALHTGSPYVPWKLATRSMARRVGTAGPRCVAPALRVEVAPAPRHAPAQLSFPGR